VCVFERERLLAEQETSVGLFCPARVRLEHVPTS